MGPTTDFDTVQTVVAMYYHRTFENNDCAGISEINNFEQVSSQGTEVSILSCGQGYRGSKGPSFSFHIGKGKVALSNNMG